MRPNLILIKSTSYAYELSNVMKTQLHQSEDSNINTESLSNFTKTMSDIFFWPLPGGTRSDMCNRMFALIKLLAVWVV